MSPEEWRAFLLAGTRTAKLATTRADGRPHVVPIGFTLDGDDLIFNTGKESVKGKNLLRDPRVMISVDDERPPFAFVLIQGVAEVREASVEEMLPWTTKIAARYMGAAKAEVYGKRNAVPGVLLVRVPLTHVIARGSVSD